MYSNCVFNVVGLAPERFSGSRSLPNLNQSSNYQKEEEKVQFLKSALLINLIKISLYYNSIIKLILKTNLATPAGFCAAQ